jgi:hypothetical protein
MLIMYFYQQASYKMTIEDPSEKYMKLYMHFHQQAPYETTVVDLTEKYVKLYIKQKMHSISNCKGYCYVWAQERVRGYSIYLNQLRSIEKGRARINKPPPLLTNKSCK